MTPHNRTAIVTGAGSGVGKASALALLADGWRVALAGRRADALDATIAAAGSAGDRALAIPADVSQPDSVRALFDAVIAKWGRLDMVFNNAGVNAPGIPVDELTFEQWKNVVDINLTGVFLCAQAAGRRMVPKGEGCIINLASMYGVVAAPDRAAYCATKGAVVLLTETLAVEWGPAGVRVNALAPGYVETDLVRDLAARGRLDPERLKQRTPLRRLAQPAEMADLAVFLASSQAAYITGHTLVADGGWSRYSYL